MKKWALILLPALSALASCDLNAFSAGSYPYAEQVSSACPRDSVVARLTRLKASGAYDNAYSFPDGPSESGPYYQFYFFSRETNCIVLVAVTGARKSLVLLASIKEPQAGSKWQDINHGLAKERQLRVLSWFNKVIQPRLMCK